MLPSEIMKYPEAQSLSYTKFKRHFRVPRKTFERMKLAIQQQRLKTARRGCPWKLKVEEQILVTLEYWREYRTHFHLASDWRVSESTVCQIVHRVENIQYHQNSYIPKKKPKIREISVLEKDYNRELAKQRIRVKHVNRRLKIFKIFAQRYRNRRRGYSLRCNLLAVICNQELSLSA